MAPEFIIKANALIAALGDLSVAQERGLDAAQIVELTRRASDASLEVAALLEAPKAS